MDVRGGSSIPGDPVVAATYAYDERNRLVSWQRGGTSEHYAYDALGNLTGYATAMSRAANQAFGESDAGPHAVTSSSASGTSVSYSYDADGNRASALGGAGGDVHYAF